MLFQNYLVAVTALATGALAKEKPVDKLLHDKLYVSGVRHMEIMSKKAVRLSLWNERCRNLY